MSYFSDDDSVTSQLNLILQVTFIVASLSFAIYIAYQRLFSPLAKVPGPFWASLTRWWLAHAIWQGPAHELYPALHRQYGQVVRIAPSEVSISEPSAMRRIYASGSGFHKSAWYSVWQGRRVFDLFGGRDERIHGQQRSVVSSAYSMKSIDSLEQYIDDAVSHFLKRLGEISSDIVDLGGWIQYFAFDVIGEVTFSKRFGLMDVGDEDGSLSTIKRAIASASWLGQLPWLYWLDDFLSPVFGHQAACQARHGKMRSFTTREVNARQDRGSDHNDILGKLFAIHEQKPHEFDVSGVTSMATSNVFAGSDTTAATARAVVYYVLKNPECERRLTTELVEAYKAGKLSRLAQRAEVDQLPFFKACMWEAMRIHPQPSLTMPRIVPSGGLQATEFFLPQGTVVGCTSWVIHKDKDVFGPDADVFNPDRWLKGDNSNMHRHMLTFGQGSRICIGKNLAEVEIKKLIPSLFLQYDLKLADPLKEWKIVSNWFALQEDFYVTIRPRKLLDSGEYGK